MKNSSDTIGNRTRDLLACSALPQPSAPPRAPYNVYKTQFTVKIYCSLCVEKLTRGTEEKLSITIFSGLQRARYLYKNDLKS